MSASGVLALPRPVDDGAGSRTRLVVAWQHVGTRQIHPVGLLEELAGGYRFRYLASALEIEGFRPLVGFPKLRASYESEALFPLFAERVMDPRRPDRARFLAALDLPSAAGPIEILAASNGHRVGDTIQLFPEPLVREDGATSCRFLVHGIRHVIARDPGTAERLARLRVDDPLELVDEPTNEISPRAVITAEAGGGALGYVPDLLLDYLHTARDIGPVTVSVAHVNGPEAPPHLRLMAHLSGRVPSSYRPFSGPAWEPIVGSA